MDDYKRPDNSRDSFACHETHPEQAADTPKNGDPQGAADGSGAQNACPNTNPVSPGYPPHNRYQQMPYVTRPYPQDTAVPPRKNYQNTASYQYPPHNRMPPRPPYPPQQSGAPLPPQRYGYPPQQSAATQAPQQYGNPQQYGYLPQYGYHPAYPLYGPPAGSGKATASMVLGIIALVFALLYMLAFVSIPCGIIGLVLGNSARKVLPPDRARSQATAGVICSIIALVLAVIMLAVFFIVIASLSSFGADLGPSFGV